MAITLSVWRALFFREALSRLFGSRASWFWLLAEPLFHMAYLAVIYTVVRVHTVGGIDTVIWLFGGMLAFFMFRRTASQVMDGVSANLALFSYRQVKPIDAVLTRGFLEGFLTTINAIVLMTGAALFGHFAIPQDILAVLEAFWGLWLLGVGFGLMASVALEVIPELGRVIKLIMMPLYMVSGVIFPLSAVPQPYREWLLMNPVAHGLEAVRLGFASHYHAAPELSVAYLYACALVTIFLGLALHRRFALRLATQ